MERTTLSGLPPCAAWSATEQSKGLLSSTPQMGRFETE
jgi:hypothetical protein